MLKDQKLKKTFNAPDLEGEVWKMHPCGKNVSNMGRMKLIYKSKQNLGNYRITLGHRIPSMYMNVTVDGKKRKIHRLVLEAFTSVDEGIGKVVDHIDRDRGNNRLDNLRWVTYKENASNRPVGKPFRHCSTCECSEFK